MEKVYTDRAVSERSLIGSSLEATETVVRSFESIPNGLRAIIERLEGPRAEKDVGPPDEAVSPAHFDRWNAAIKKANHIASEIYELLDHLDSLI